MDRTLDAGVTKGTQARQSLKVKEVTMTGMLHLPIIMQRLTPANAIVRGLVAAQVRTTPRVFVVSVRRCGVARSPTPLPISVRRFSAPATPAESSSRFRPKVSHLFGGLVGLGLLLTIYGL